MKRYIRNSHPAEEQFLIDEIVSVVLTDDLESYNPRDAHVYAAKVPKKIDYSSLNRDQLLELGPKELSKIHDARILRKLEKEDLTVQQQIELYHANSENHISTIQEVKNALAKLKACHSFHIWDTEKNKTFFDKIYELGGRVRDEDAYNIIHNLHVKDYSYSTFSYLDKNWNALLMVFEYDKPYTFVANEPEGQPVTVESMDLYIKIDIDNRTRTGYAAMSFHDAEFKMSHPYANYPEDKE